MDELTESGLPRDEPVGQLPPQPWMEAPETRAVLAALTADGAEARFVGGCVRDAVLRRPIRDIDIATHDPPERVMTLLERAGLKAVPTGIDHGTVTAVAGGKHFEITTLRRDVETFGRHARVVFTDDWTADAARRDFTINALFCRPDGMIFDPFDGLADLGAGRVRFVGDPLRRIDEDVLRLLRFFRFYAHYGRPPPDVAAMNACRARAHKLPSLSGERLCGEMIKLLQAPDPASVLLLMHGVAVLSHLLPEAHDFGALRVLTFLETRGIVRPHIGVDPLRRLAALLTVDKAAAQAVAARFKMSNAQADRLAAMAAPDVRPDPAMDRRAARRLLHHIGAELFRDLTLLAWAHASVTQGHFGPANSGRWLTLLDYADEWTPVSLPVAGRDVLALGVPTGPGVGAALAAVQQWWEDADFAPDRMAALAKLKAVVATGR